MTERKNTKFSYLIKDKNYDIKISSSDNEVLDEVVFQINKSLKEYDKLKDTKNTSKYIGSERVGWSH